MVAQLVPLLWRRRHPLLVYTVVAGACGLQVLLLDYPLVSQVAYPIAVYSVARYASPRWAWPRSRSVCSGPDSVPTTG